MLLTRKRRPTPRRLTATAWFVAFMAFVFLFDPLIEGRGIDRAALGWLVPVGIVGYLLWPAWEGAATADGRTALRKRMGMTAVGLAAGVAAVVTFDVVVSGDIDAGTLLQAVVVGGGTFLFVMTMPRIVGGRWT